MVPDLPRVTEEFRDVVEGIDPAALRRVGERHEDIAHVRPVLGLVEEGVLAVQNRPMRHALLELQPWVTQFTVAGPSEVSNRFLKKVFPQMITWSDTVKPIYDTALAGPKGHAVAKYNARVAGFLELRQFEEYRKPRIEPPPQ